MFIYTLLLVVTSALGAAATQGQDPSYRSNREYVYEYESQVLTGIPQGSKIYSGLKFRTDVYLQFRTGSRATLKFRKLSLYKINDPIESADPTRQQIPENLFQPLTGPEANRMRQDLAKPISFKYLQGSISDLERAADDPEWSVNTKRGFLSFFEMNLEKRKSLDDTSVLPRVIQAASRDSSMHYVMEPSVTGECETMYRIQPEKSSNGKPLLYVTKVRNYENCINRPRFSSSIFRGMYCTECVKDESSPLRSASQIRYTLTGNSRQFLIRSAIGESQHVFTPYTDEGGHVATYINQTLNLVKMGDITDRIQSPRSPRKESSALRADIPKTTDQSQQSGANSRISKPTPAKKEQSERKEKILKLLKMMEVFMKNYVQEEAGPVLFSFVEEMRRSDSKTLTDVYNDIEKRSMTDKRQWKMFIDLLPSVGTPAAVDVIFEAIKNNKLSFNEARLSLNILSVSSRPNILIAKRILELTKNPMLTKNRPLKRSTYLTLGTIANKLKEEKNERSKEIRKQEEIIKKLLSSESRSPVRKDLKSKQRSLQDRKRKVESIYIKIKREIIKEVQALMKSTDYDDKLMAVKTMGNCGFREMIREPRSMIEDKSLPPMFRAQAIYSLRKLAPMYPRMIQDVLLPRFFDRTEREEVRIASYHIMTKTNPGRPLLEMIAQSLRRETNPHVGTFVYTHLEQTSNSTLPCYQSWIKNATFAMRFAKKFNPLYHYSRFLHFPVYDEKTKSGGAMDIGLISSPEEFMPSAGAFHFSAQVLGKSIDFGEIGFHTEGLQTLLSKIIGPRGELTKGKSVVDLVKERKPRSTSQSSSSNGQSNPEQQSTPQPSSDDDVSKAHKELKVQLRESPKPAGHVYLKMFGSEIQYIPLDASLVQSIMKEGKIALSTSEKELKDGHEVDIHQSLLVADADLSVPTEAGLPLTLKYRGSSVLKVTGKTTVTGVPSLFESNRPGKRASELAFNFDIRPSFLLYLRGEMEVDAKYYKTGVSLKALSQAETPLSLSSSLDLRKAKLITKMNLEKLSEKLAKMEVTPETYIKEEPIEISRYPSPRKSREISVTEGARLIPISTEVGRRELGIAIGLKGQRVMRNFLRGVPFYPLTGKQELYITLSPGLQPQKYAELQFQCLIHMQRPSPSQQQSPKQGPEQEEDSRRGILTWFTSLLSSKSEPRRESPSSSKLPKDLKSEDSSLTDIIKQLTPSGEQSPPEEGSVGFMFNLLGLDEGRTSKRHIHLSALYNRERISKDVSMYLSLKRSPVPERETKPWKFDMNIKIRMPRRIVDPSELLQPSHQREIKRLIEIRIQNDGRPELVLKLKNDIAVQQVRDLQKMQSSTNGRQVIDEIVNNLMSRSKESSKTDTSSLIKLVKEQKKIIKDVRKLQQRSYDPLRVRNLDSKVRSVISKSEDIKSRLKTSVLSTSKQTDDKKRVLLEYSKLLQQILQKEIESSVKSLKPSLPQQKRNELQQKLQRSQESSRQLLKAEVQSQNSQKNDQSRSQDSLTRSVSELLKKQNQVRSHLSNSKESDGVKGLDDKQIQDIVKKSKDVVESVRQHLIKPSSSSVDHVEESLLRAAIKQQQLIETLRKRLRESEPKRKQSQKQKEKIQKLVKQLQRENEQIAKVVSRSVRNRIERESSQDLPPDERKDLEKLQKVELLQLDVAGRLKRSSASPEKETQAQRTQDLQRSQELVEQAGRSIVSVIDQKDISKRPVQVLLKLIRISQAQASLSGEIKRKSERELIKSVSTSKVKDRQIEKLKERAEIEKIRYIRLSEKMLSSVRSHSSLRLSDTQSDSRVDRVIDQIEREQEKQEEKSRHIQKVPRQDEQRKSTQGREESVRNIISNLRRIQDSLRSALQEIEVNRIHLKSIDVSEKMKSRITEQKRLVEKIKRLVSSVGVKSPEKEKTKKELDKQLTELRELSRRQEQLSRESQKQQQSEESTPRDPSTQRSPKEDPSKQVSLQRDQSNSKQRDERGRQQKQSKKSESDDSSRGSQSSRQGNHQRSDSQRSDTPSSSRDQRRQQNNRQSSSSDQTPDDPSRQPQRLQPNSKKQTKSEGQRRSSDQSSDQSKQSQRQQRLDQVEQSRRESRPQNREESKRPESRNDRNFKISIKIEFGPVGEKRNSIEIEALGTPSIEQLLWEQAQSSPLQRSRITRQYLSDVEDGTEELKTSYKRLEKELNLARHLHINVKFQKEELPFWFRENAWRWQESVKARYYRHMEMQLPRAPRPRNSFQILLDFLRNDRQVDMSFKLPEEDYRFRGIVFPYYYTLFMESLESMKDRSPRRLEKSLSSVTKRLPGICEVKQDAVRTLDDQLYRIPDTKKCDIVLTMDCSASKAFLVTSRKDEVDPKKKVVKVSVGGRKVELAPKGESVSVQVDGQVQEIRDRKPHVVPKDSSSSQQRSTQSKLMTIERERNKVTVSIPRQGVRVSSDGSKITVQVSPFYYSRVCGLCGNYDGKPDNELQSPEKQQHRDPKCFVQSYLLKSDKCDVQEARKGCQSLQSSSKCQPNEETIRRTRIYNRKSQICLSQTPVKRCESGCEPTEIPKSKPVKMVCLDADSSKARKLERESYHRPLTELKSEQAQYTEYVQEPVACRQA